MMRISPLPRSVFTYLVHFLFFIVRPRKRQIHPGEGRRLAQVLQGPFEREGGEGEGERGGRRQIERSAKVVAGRRQVSRGEKKFTRQVSGEGRAGGTVAQWD